MTTNVQPAGPVLVGRCQVRFEGVPTGQLHQDGSFYAALPLNLQSDHANSEGPKRLFQRGLELDLVALVQAAAAWAAETGSAGDLVLSGYLKGQVRAWPVTAGQAGALQVREVVGSSPSENISQDFGGAISR